MFYILNTFLLLLLLSMLMSSSSALQCVDEEGSPVDWLVIYKLPREAGKKQKTDGFIGQGKAYAYFTSKTTDGNWILSEKSVEDPTSIPGRILDPLYNKKQSDELMFIFYNDEHPEGNTSFTMGHTKGVIAYDKKIGFWLVHSVPKYPPHPETGSYGYPSTGEKFGQSFLCISIETPATADLIGLQFTYNHPYVYSFNIPGWATGQYPHMTMAAKEQHVKSPPFFHTVQFRSLDGLLFTSFAKYTTFGKDLYADLVLPSLKSNLMVETWPNGPGKMNSSCRGPFQVENIDEIDFSKVAANVDFTTKHDHSKWAISYSTSASKLRRVRNDANFVCIGDINRMETQKKRGGGTVCFQNNFAWKAFTGIVKNIETCPIKA